MLLSPPKPRKIAIPCKAEDPEIHSPVSLVSNSREGSWSTKTKPFSRATSHLPNLNAKKSYNNLRNSSSLALNPSRQTGDCSPSTRKDSIVSWYSLPDEDATAYITPMSSPRPEHLSDSRLSMPQFSDSETSDDQSACFSESSDDGDFFDAPIMKKESIEPAAEDSGLCLLDMPEGKTGPKKSQVMDEDPSSPSLPPLILRKGSRNTRIPSRRVRSRSVPAPLESTANSESPESNSVDRISTWGLGSKGVSEDWDEDFDFDICDGDDIDSYGHGFIPLQQLHVSDDLDNEVASPDYRQTQSDKFMSRSQKGSGEMKIPEAIMQRQESVHAQYGQVQELTFLVDELKNLVAQGESLRIVMESAKFKEAKGIINLANSEDLEDKTHNSICEDDNSIDGDFEELVRDIVTSSMPPSPRPSTVASAPPPPTFSSRLPPFAPKINQLSKDNLKSRPSVPTLSQVSVEAAFSCPSTVSGNARSSSVPSSPLPPFSPRFDDCSVNELSEANGCKEQNKLSFDSHSLKTLVTRAGSVAQSLKEIIHQAEGSTSKGDLKDAFLPHFGVSRQPNRTDVREVFDDLRCESECFP